MRQALLLAAAVHYLLQALLLAAAVHCLLQALPLAAQHHQRSAAAVVPALLRIVPKSPLLLSPG